MERSLRAAAKRAGEMGVVMSVGVGVAILSKGGGVDVVIAAIVFGNCWGRWARSFEVFLDGRAKKVIWSALTNVVRFL